MNWAILIPVILQYGLPFAEKIYALWSTNTAPSQADWDALRVLAAQNAHSQMLAALQRANIDPASAQGQALLGLVPAA